MRIGLQVTNFTWPNDQGSLGETFALVAQRAERVGLFSLWVMDHFFQIPGSVRLRTRCWKATVRWPLPQHEPIGSSWEPWSRA